MAVLSQQVLLLEDDPLMQRFVSLALEDEPLELTCCSSVSQAMQAIEQHAFDWILTDLMLPGESGLHFIEKISLMPELLGPARIVALSAGIDLVMQDRLTELGVKRQLLKPVSVKVLQELLRSGLEHAEPPDRTLSTCSTVIETYFGGQADLYEKFSQQSRLQFAQDIYDGERAVQEKNSAALHNNAHSLKSVLLLLGEANAHQCAETLENLTGSADFSTQAAQEWQKLKNHLIVLAVDQPH
ncbi:MAG: response regulator [Sheuella sp.]|nr:response regulator [Sheuella sp.]